ncbi:MAG: hypothetical protein NTW01_00255 [Gammaproteobacteria bacterium]|uniref:hypothetical protein n=1 Tax=Nevskia sp. TaxID=1929292 RepID=UPI004036DA9F|nr:hypothetical protein [Gammaproteobacteria bacterium]
MSMLLAALSMLIALLTAGLGWALLRLQRRVDALHGQLVGDPAAALAPGRIGPVIEIRILNPFDLAVKETPLAGPAAKVAPRMIERIVYSRAAQQIAEQLKAQGVEAQVTTHGA